MFSICSNCSQMSTFTFQGLSAKQPYGRTLFAALLFSGPKFCESAYLQYTVQATSYRLYDEKNSPIQRRVLPLP